MFETVILMGPNYKEGFKGLLLKCFLLEPKYEEGF
jgi:hypothetical protein